MLCYHCESLMSIRPHIMRRRGLPLHWLDLCDCRCSHPAAARHAVPDPAAAFRLICRAGLDRPTCTCGHSKTARHTVLDALAAPMLVWQVPAHRKPAGLPALYSSTHHEGPSQLRCVLQELLPRIVALWHALHVPLVHRSRFYLAFQGREAFYFESEHRRLVYLAGQASVDPGKPLQVPLQSGSLGSLSPLSPLNPLPMSYHATGLSWHGVLAVLARHFAGGVYSRSHPLRRCPGLQVLCVLSACNEGC